MKRIRAAAAASVMAGCLAFGATPAAAQGFATGRTLKKTTKVEPKQEVPAQYKDVPAVLRFKMRDIDGKDVELKDYQGKVILLVNTASQCGYTPQYAQLQELYDKYKDQGFVVLAFPSNDFDQEKGDAKEIKQFCTDKYKVAFPIFDKVQVKDPKNACDLYKLLADKKTNSYYGGDIKWNFTKFLIDRKGAIRGRWEAKVEPKDPRVVKKIESLLKVKIPKPKKDGDAAKDAKNGEAKDKPKPNPNG